MSVVPPPISTTMLPHALEISMPEPMAAAMGSSMMCTRLAPACLVASSTARFSTSVTLLGTQTAMVGFTKERLPNAFSMKYCSIFSVTS